MKRRQYLTQDNVNLLVYIFQKRNNILAINKLWDFYFPLIVSSVLYHIAKEYPEMDEFAADIIDESYFSFIDGALLYNMESYCFGEYIQTYIEKEVFDNLKKYRQERACFGPF